MTLAIEDVVGILTDNLARRGSVMPIPARRATQWADRLDLPTGGPTVLYTGLMYQVVPYIERLVRLQQLVADSPLARLSGVARRANRLVNGLGLLARPPSSERAPYDRVLENVARLLMASGVRFGYLYGDELYVGALTYDLGAEEVVAAHAAKVAEVLARHGVREVITVDPHTTNMLRTVYPRLVPGFDVVVRSYLEVLADPVGAEGVPRTAPDGASQPSGKGEADVARGAPAAGEGGAGGAGGRLPRRVVIHDSCVYARHEGVIAAPRLLLAATGREVVDPANAGALTWCCGGPAESLFPAKAAAVASTRVAQLRDAAADCVTMCPICLVNLRKAAGDELTVRDISEYLVEERH